MRGHLLVRHPVVAVTTLAAFLGTQCIFPLACVYAQTTRQPRPMTSPARAMTVPGSREAKIKPSAPLRSHNCEVSMQALDLSRPPGEAELRAAGQMGGALSPMSPADAGYWVEHFDKELKRSGIPGGLRESAPPTTPAGKLLLSAKERIKRLQTSNLLFGQAIQEWNQHNYRAAAGMFERFIEKYPDSPWAGEALLHLGCDSKYNGRFSEAQARYDFLLKNSSGDPRQPSYDVHQKAKLRWADLDIALGKWRDATAKLADILQTERDWRRRTWAAHWIRNLNSYQRSARDLRACGTQALSVVFASLGQPQAATRLAHIKPTREDGFSLTELAELSRRQGVPMRGFQARPQQLADLPMPLLIHYDFDRSQAQSAAFGLTRKPNFGMPDGQPSATAGQQSLHCPEENPSRPAPPKTSASSRRASSSITNRKLVASQPVFAKQPAARPSPFRIAQRAGHYLVVQRVDKTKGVVNLYDPQEKRRYYLSYAELDKEWSGKGLVRIAKATTDVPQAKPRAAHTRLQPAPRNTQVAWLSPAEMERTVGGCCGVQRPPTEMGNDGDNEPGDPNNCSSRGAPVWSVNRINLNMFITDTPIWYDTPIGPDVEITQSYNSQDATNQNTAFGNKWVFNYGSYLVEDTGAGGGVVTIFMPDGRQDNYIPDGRGGYTTEVGIFNKLKKRGATTYELTFPAGDKFIYAIPAGTTSLQPFLVEIQDRWGFSLRFGYNAQVRLTTITDAQNKITRLTYDAGGHITRAEDPFGRFATFSYDANGNMVEAVDMGGNAFQYTYDADVRVTQLNTPQGPWQFYHEWADANSAASDIYPAPGAPMWENVRLTVTDPLNQKEEYMYYGGLGQTPQTPGLDGLRSWHVDKNHYVEYQTWNVNNGSHLVPKKLWVANARIDGKGKVGAFFNPSLDGQTFSGESYGYDSATGQRSSIVNTRGNSTTFTYNAKGQITSSTDPKNRTTKLKYAPNGLDVTSVENALGRKVVSSTYNTRHQPVNVTDGLGNTTSLSYTRWGAPASITDASGTTTYNYDPTSKRLTSITRPTATGTATLAGYTYDNVGRVRTRTDARGLTLTYDYNNLNKVTRVTYPDTTHIDYEYDCACGLVSSVKDRAGRTTHYDYDPLKRLIRVRDAANDTTEMNYDKVGNLTQLTDTNGNRTKFEYDSNNRLIKKIYVDGSYERYTYDGNNNLVSYRNARGQLTNFSYDDNDNRTRIGYSSGPAVTIAYDALNRPVRMVDATGTTTFSYDLLGRLTSEDGPWLNDKVSYRYDAVGRRQQILLNNANAANYSYDTLSRLSTISSPAGTFTYNYDGVSSLVSALALPNGSSTNYTYDTLGRLSQIQNRKQNLSNISRYTYGYDTRDIRTFVEQQVGADPLQRINFGYGTVDQLTSEVSTEVPTPQVNNLYTYDAMGNRSSAQNSGQRTTYSRNGLNQYTGFTTTVGSATATTGFGYDADGNTTAVGRSGRKETYLYDDANRLVRYTRLNTTTGVREWQSEFVYDGLSRKRITREYSWVNNAWQLQSETRSIYDGMQVIQERNANNTVKATYTRGLDIDGSPGGAGGIGGLLARSVPGSTSTSHYYYHYDGRGNVVQLTDAAQSTVATYSYDAFGNGSGSASGAQSGQPYRFSTKEYHAQTGLYDFGYRFYWPGMGRWINRDPIKEKGGLNLYGFVYNSPTNLIDPDGRIVPLLLIAAGAVVGGAVGGSVYHVASENRSGWGYAGAVAGGAIAGGVGVVAAPIASALGLGSGVVGTAIVNAGAGVAAAAATAALDPCQDFTPGYAISSGAFGAAGGAIGNRLSPTIGMSNFGQVGFPRTLSGVIPRMFGGNAGPNAMNGIYLGGSVSVGVGAAGPFGIQ